MHRNKTMQESINQSIKILYGEEFYYNWCFSIYFRHRYKLTIDNCIFSADFIQYYYYCFPIFHRNNFYLNTGLKTKDGYKWIDIKYKYPRFKFLKWCEENAYIVRRRL